MNADPPVDASIGGGEGAEVGEVIRFDVVDHGPEVRVLHVVGELDTLTSPLLAGQLAEQQSEVAHLVVDLSDVSFLGSAGLAALVEAKEAADSSGKQLLLVPGSRIAKRALEATGLLGLFTIADDVPEALAAAR
ncbi:MAG TPA: STAS domain-containing protein [Pseudonocardia sp.]